jgi:hypothetical protein
MRQEMLERGFTRVGTPPFFDDRLLRGLKKGRTVLPSNCKRWWKFPQLARYGFWLDGLLGRSLCDESLSLAVLEFRHEVAGLEDKEVDRLHADGSYIRSVFTLFGPTTIYRDRDVERSGRSQNSNAISAR